jgi:Flp pilus assembly protein TadD
LGARARSATAAAGLLAATVVLSPAVSAAQAADAFARSVVDFINASQDTAPGSARAMAAAVDGMAAGLAEWDEFIRRVEAGLAAEIAAAPPAAAAKMRMALGATYLERGRFAAALTQFDTAARLAPEWSEVHRFRGVLLERTGPPADAAAAFQRAWQLNRADAAAAYRFLRAARHLPESPEAAAALAALLAAVETAGSAGGRDRAAAPPSDASFALDRLALLDDALAPAPVMPRPEHAAAFSLLERGRYDDAVARFRSGSVGPSVGPAEPPRPVVGAAPYFTAIGRQAHLRLDLDAAVAAYEERLAATPGDSAAHDDLADVYRARDDNSAALAEAAAAALLDPARVRPLVMIGQLQMAAGRDADAVRVLRRAIELAPADTEARYAISRALLRTGRPEEAQRELDIYRALQVKAMDEERQRFKDNERKINETLAK